MTTTGCEPAVAIVDHGEFQARLADLFIHAGVPAAQAAGIAEILFFIFIALFVLALVVGLLARA